MIPQLVSGDLDVAGSNVVSVMVASSQGLPLQMVAAGTSTSEDPEQDFSAPDGAGGQPDHRHRPAGGKKVAVNSLRNINDIVLGHMLEEAGLSYDSVEFVEMPFPDMAAAVQAGDVDAAVLIEPFITVAEQQGLKIIGRPYSDLKPGLQIGTYVMTEQYVRSNPDAVEAFQEGVQATADAIRRTRMPSARRCRSWATSRRSWPTRCGSTSGRRDRPGVARAHPGSDGQVRPHRRRGRPGPARGRLG